MNSNLAKLLHHRSSLLRIAENTHHAAGPKWSRDITAFFDQLARDPDTALGRGSVAAIMRTITSLIIAEGITVASGPADARTAEIRSSPGYDLALAAATDLLQAVKRRDSTLGHEFFQLMMDMLAQYLELVHQRDVEIRGARPAA